MLQRAAAVFFCVAELVGGCHSSASAPAPREPRRAAPSASGPTLAGDKAPPDPPPIDRPTSKPFAGDASVYEHPKRAERLRIDQVMDLLGITPGKTVADVGAGGGWFSVRAARRVGPDGRVYAVEINKTYLEQIATRAEREDLPNLHALEGTDSDPGLAAGSIDVVLLLKTYHELSQPIAILKSLRRAMRPSARLGIIDRNGAGNDHGVNEAVVRKEVLSVGFKFVERRDWVSAEERVDYFLVFER